MHRRRYIEIDPAWWSDPPAAPTQMARLVCALVADGWTTAKACRRVRLVRRFATDSEYRVAIARARFTVAAYLMGNPPGQSYAPCGDVADPRDMRRQ
jgi:hypothetical protein